MARPDEKPETEQEPGNGGGTLGTFAGVFTPSILTILGIILFLRLGYVVGESGLLRALAIILLANGISILTSISLSAVATNLRVKGGGDYYLISRTLGVEFGGALGLVLFMAQSVSIAFYAIGFGEALGAILGRLAEAGSIGSLVAGDRVPQVVAAVAVSLLFVLAWLGADWATRFQYVVMAVLFTAIAAFLAGGLAKWDSDLLASNMSASGELPFWIVFAVFFPAVTGFTQGVSLSGDLRTPGNSIPRGTFLAVGLSLVVYVVAAVVFAASVEGEVLIADKGVMRRVAPFGWLVDAGVIAATLSSALASFLGAPRILQSLASDRVFPWLNVFSAGSGPTNNPRRGVLLSAAIAYGTIALGDLDFIAPVVSMFFLISYGLLNYATYVEAQANSPSFRPRFRFFNARLSLIGALGCLGAMLAISPTAALVAVVTLFAIHHYVSATVSVDRWADSSRSQRFQRMRRDLAAILGKPKHPRYWRPILLLFSGEPARRERLLRVASWLEGGSGITTAVQLVEGEGAQGRKLREEADKELRAEIDRLKLSAFARSISAADPDTAISVVLQSYGLGPLRANTVLLDWLDPTVAGGTATLEAFGRRLRLPLRYSCNLGILSAEPVDFEEVSNTRATKRLIDVWYRDNATGRLTLLLAYLMTRCDDWKDARIRVFAPAAEGQSHRKSRQDLERMLEEVRIVAEPRIVDGLNTRSIVTESSGSSLVFVPFRLSNDVPTTVGGEPLEELVRVLGLTVLTLASEDIALDAEPEAGEPGEMAQAADAAEKASKAAVKAQKEAEKGAEAAEKLKEKVEEALANGPPDEVAEVTKLTKSIKQAEEAADKAKRRAAKARAKAETATREAEELASKPAETETEEPEDGADES